MNCSKYNKIAYWSSLSLLLVLVLLIYSSLSEWDINYLIKSDTLYLPSIYNDLFVNGNTIKGWNVNPAPNFFPDMPVYFLLYFISGEDILLTGLLYSLIQIAATSLLFLLLLKQLIKAYWEYGFIVNVILTLLLSVHAIDDHFLFSFEMLINSFHYSSFLCAIAGYTLWFKYFNSGKNSMLLWLLLFTFICIVSDKLFLITFCIPAIILSLLNLGYQWRKALTLMLVIGLGAFIGLKAFNSIINSGIIYIPQPHRYLDFENIKTSWGVLLNQYQAYLKPTNVLMYILIGTFVSTILSIFLFIKNSILLIKHKSLKLSNKESFSILLSFYTIGVILAPVLNGNYTGWDTIRYNISAYILALILLPLILSNFNIKGVKKLTKYKVASAITIQALILVFCIVLKPTNSLNEYINYKPQFVKLLDNACEKLDVKYGIAPYNDAKLSSMFSDIGLNVFAVFDEQTPWFHVTNNNWFYRKTGQWDERLEFDFVVGRDDNAKKHIYNLLSPLQDSVVYENFTVYKSNPFYYPEGEYLPKLVK